MPNKICTFNVGSTTKNTWNLNNESLQTFLAEVEVIVNTRPITSVHSPFLLCPMQLLAMKSRVVMPPPWEFQKEDIYNRKQWRRVQHLANEFWSRWKKEAYATLQVCHKWSKLWETLRLERLFCFGRRQVGTSDQWIE